MGSNPQIDRIALDAMDRAWLAQVETEAVAYFVGGAAVHTAVSATYADGPTYTRALRAQMAALAAATLYQATVVVPASKEYIAAAEADDTTGRAAAALRPAGQRGGRVGGRVCVGVGAGHPAPAGPVHVRQSHAHPRSEPRLGGDLRHAGPRFPAGVDAVGRRSAT